MTDEPLDIDVIEAKTERNFITAKSKVPICELEIDVSSFNETIKALVSVIRQQRSVIVNMVQACEGGYTRDIEPMKKVLGLTKENKNGAD